MGSFGIEWKRSAEREVRKIDPVQIPVIIQALDSLTRDPSSAGSRKLQGREHHYRIRVGDYRVIYQVEARNKVVTIYLSCPPSKGRLSSLALPQRDEPNQRDRPDRPNRPYDQIDEMNQTDQTTR